MFDLPVKTKPQRKSASDFRNFLLDEGFSMVQYSVYTRYMPLGVNLSRLASTIKSRLPLDGEVRIVPVTDKQWAEAFRFRNGSRQTSEKTPDQLLIF
nr:CRISPR-associated endonuclease Cas2 [Corynebacterium auris]